MLRCAEHPVVGRRADQCGGKKKTCFTRRALCPHDTLCDQGRVVHSVWAEGIRRSDLFKVRHGFSTLAFTVLNILIFVIVRSMLDRHWLVGWSHHTVHKRYKLHLLGDGCLLWCRCCLPNWLAHWIQVCKVIYFIYELVCGHIIFVPLFLLSATELFGHIQTWLLYHNALSTNVVVSDILRYARTQITYY
jgi:hypothetical protein